VFEQVCQAVGYAHARNVIHRDLKPHNVMVGAFGEVQVMDWGLAKVLTPPGRRATDPPDPYAETLPMTAIVARPDADRATQTGSLLGTSAFMSPEQAGGEINKIDQRADVFGLGAILCVILTGQPPYIGPTSEAVRLQAVRGRLADAFARLDRCGAEPDLISLAKRCLAAAPADRPADGAEVAAALAGMRAAEERARRAAVEVRDVEQRKRRRVRLGLAAVLLLGMVVSAVLAMLADHARRAAETAEANEREQREAAEANEKKANDERERAEREKQIADAVREFLQYKLLRQADVREQANAFLRVGEGSTGAKENLTVRELLDRAAKELTPDKIESQFPKQPLVQAEILHTIGLTYLEIGAYEAAIANLTRARDLLQQQVGPDHTDTLTALVNLARAYMSAGKLPEAIPLFEQVRDQRIQKLGPDHRDTLGALNNLAVAYQAAAKFPEAIRLLEQVRDTAVEKLGPDHPDTLCVLNNLATAYLASKKLPEAIRLFEEARRKAVERLGADHPDTLTAGYNLAGAYLAVGKLPEAMPLLEEVRDRRAKTLGPDNPKTLETMNKLGVAYFFARRLDLAVPLFEETLRRRAAKLGPDNPDTLETAFNLAVNYRDTNRLPDAVKVVDEWLPRVKNKLGLRHPKSPFLVSTALDIYERAKMPAKAEPMLREVMEFVKKQAGADSLPYAGQLAQLGHNLLQQNKPAEAEPVLRECLAIREKKEPDGWLTFNAKSMLGGVFMAQKKYADAEPLLLQGYEGMREREAKIPPVGKLRIPEALERLVQLYESWDKKDEAAKWRKTLEELKGGPKKPKE
jgi:serine/threonine protein kinase